MVDVGVQTSPPSQLQTDLDIGTSMTNNSYLQMPVTSAQPLDTAFISSPKKDQDTSDMYYEEQLTFNCFDHSGGGDANPNASASSWYSKGLSKIFKTWFICVKSFFSTFSMTL